MANCTADATRINIPVSRASRINFRVLIRCFRGEMDVQANQGGPIPEQFEYRGDPHYSVRPPSMSHLAPISAPDSCDGSVGRGMFLIRYRLIRYRLIRYRLIRYRVIRWRIIG